MIVAIDGPGGAGKSSVARAVAKALGISFLDTGAMYRAIALAALEAGVPLDDGGSIGDLARARDVVVEEETVLLDGRDVTDRIRAETVTRAVSRVSAHPEVRASMTTLQRALAERGDFVMEGRDIGSVVVPQADVKIFLTASLEERALRRARQLGLPEDPSTLAETAAAISARDAADSSRAASPLIKAPDAVELDTTSMSFDDVVDAVVRLVRERVRG